MVNVGGVEAGNIWKDEHGSNLRKCYLHPRKDLHPQVFYLKKLLRRLNAKHRRLLSVLELVGSFDKQHVFIEGVEEAAEEEAFLRKRQKMQEASQNVRHPFHDLPVPSPYDLIYQFMRRESKYFDLEACTFVTKKQISTAICMDARVAASTLSHHPLCMNVVMCGVARVALNGSTDENQGRGPELESTDNSVLVCLGAREWFLMGRNLLLALRDVYRDFGAEVANAGAEHECHREEEEPEGCIPHPLWRQQKFEVSHSSRCLKTQAFQTAKMALTHGQSALVRRHRSIVIREAFASHFRKHKGPSMSTQEEEEEEASSGDEFYLQACLTTACTRVMGTVHRPCLTLTMKETRQRQAEVKIKSRVNRRDPRHEVLLRRSETTLY